MSGHVPHGHARSTPAEMDVLSLPGPGVLGSSSCAAQRVRVGMLDRSISSWGRNHGRSNWCVANSGSRCSTRYVSACTKRASGPMSSLAEPGAEAVQPSGVGADGADGKQPEAGGVC